jgi:hypothetical protein
LFFGDVFDLVLEQMIVHNNSVRRVKQLPARGAGRHFGRTGSRQKWLLFLMDIMDIMMNMSINLGNTGKNVVLNFGGFPLYGQPQHTNKSY